MVRPGRWGAEFNLGGWLTCSFEPARKRFTELMGNQDRLRQILNNGAARARDVARNTLAAVRHAVGTDGIRRL